MKIAVWYNLPSGGGKRALYEHVRGLVARGHTVEAWCPPTADREFLPLSSMIPEHVVDLEWPDRSRRINTWRVERSIAAMDVHCQSCANQIAQGEFDILFASACRFFDGAGSVVIASCLAFCISANHTGRYTRHPRRECLVGRWGKAVCGG